MKRQLFAVLLWYCLIGYFCGSALASPPQVVEQIILILWHGLTWDDVSTIETDGPLAMGFLNTRSGGGEALTGSYLSLGAGARAVGFAGAATFYQDTAQELYRRHTGLEPSPIIQPKIAQIHAAQTVNYRIEPGALGSGFAGAGVSVRVLGNSDGLDPFHWAALVAMDGTGRVWEGSVGTEFTLLDADYPYGQRTDYGRLATEIIQAEERLVIADLGDPFRYDQYQHQLLPQQQEKVRRVMVEEARLFVEDMVQRISDQAVVMVVSPYPSNILARQGYWLTPVLCWGLAEGLLVSGTTRWPGLITNMDVAPTILELLQIEHEQPFVGRRASIESVAVEVAKSQLETMAGKIGYLSRFRSQVLRCVIIGQILIYSAVLLSLILSTSLPLWGVRLLQISLLLLLAVPLALLLWDKVNYGVFVLMLGLAILAGSNVKPLPLVGLISLATAAALSLDVMRGSWLIRYSFLGYDPIGGARFYGIGNEFMGVLIGSAIMGWAVVAEQTVLGAAFRRSLGFLLFGALIVVIGAPSLGTNVGGAISAVFGFGSTWMSFRDKKINFWTIVALSVATALVLSALMFVDGANSTGKQSHIGQTVDVLRRDGVQAVFLIITRKLAMNLRLLRYSIWSRALVVALVGMGASFIWPSKFIFWLKENHPFIAKGIGGVVIGSTAAFIFNDSGVVAAATCLSFASSTLLLLALELKHNLATP